MRGKEVNVRGGRDSQGWMVESREEQKPGRMKTGSNPMPSPCLDIFTPEPSVSVHSEELCASHCRLHRLKHKRLNKIHPHNTVITSALKVAGMTDLLVTHSYLSIHVLLSEDEISHGLTVRDGAQTTQTLRDSLTVS